MIQMKNCLSGKMNDGITSIGGILSLEKALVTLEWLLAWVVRKVKEELAQSVTGGFSTQITTDEVFVEVKSRLEFAREINRKAVSYGLS